MNDEKNASSILKEYGGLIISTIGLCGTVFTFLVQAILITYETSRYTALAIPLYFIRQSYALFDTIRMICLFVAVSFAITVTILLASYKKYIDACMEFDQIFHTEKLPKQQYYIWKTNVWMTVLATLFSVNQSVIAILVIQEEWEKTAAFCMLLFCEFIFAKIVLLFIMERRKDKINDEVDEQADAVINYTAFKPYNDNDKERIVTRREIRQTCKKYRINRYILSYNQTGFVMAISIAVLALFIGAQFLGLLDPINKTCQIVNEDNQTFVVLTTINDKCIVSPVNIKEDTEGENVLYVYNRKQAIMELSDLTYEIESFDRIELMDKQ